MARDIEEFLRKAAERRKQQKSGNTSQPKQQPSQQKQPQQRRPPQTRSQPSQPQSQSPQPRRPGQPLPSHAPAAETVIVLDSSAIIDEPRLTPHLKSSIDTTSISRHADALGSGISSAAAKVKERTLAGIWTTTLGASTTPKPLLTTLHRRSLGRRICRWYGSYGAY